jgi:PRTRC genetic system protein A
MGKSRIIKGKGWVYENDQMDLPMSRNYGYGGRKGYDGNGDYAPGGYHDIPGALYGERYDWRDRSSFTPEPARPEVPLAIRIAIERQLIDYKVDFNGDVMECELPPGKLVNIFQHEGIYGAIDLSFARLCVQLTKDEWKGQHQVINEGFKLKIPKMPGSLYAQILAFFRYYVIDLKLSGVTEAMSQVYWDSEKQEYFINIPEQEVTTTSVRYNFDNQDPRTLLKTVTKVFDIHSHNTMAAFFSGTDDGDEKGKQFYGVIGTIGKDNHTEKFRIGINGEFFDINKEDVIDMSSFQETGVSFPEEWKAKITIPKTIMHDLSEDRVTTYRYAGPGRSVRFLKDHTGDNPSFIDNSEVETEPWTPGDYREIPVDETDQTEAEHDYFKDEIESLLTDVEKPTQMRKLIREIMKTPFAQVAMETMAHIAVQRRKQQGRK